jgi:hypothetical protein
MSFIFREPFTLSVFSMSIRASIGSETTFGDAPDANMMSAANLPLIFIAEILPDNIFYVAHVLRIDKTDNTAQVVFIGAIQFFCRDDEFPD